MTSKSLNIALLPDNETVEKAIELSENLSQNFPTKFSLNKTDKIPHLTIYQAQFPEENIEKLIDLVRKKLETLKKFKIYMNDFFITRQGNVWWNTKNFENIKELQDEIVKKTNPLRNDLWLPILPPKETMKSDELFEASNYGSFWVGKRYLPHISVSGIDPNISKYVLEFLGENKVDEFTCSKMFVGYLGDYGTVTGIIEEFELA